MIQEFATNEVLRESVHEYITECFRQETIEKVFNRVDVRYIADAKELLDKAFGQMKVEFAPKKTIKPLNEAR